MRGGRAARAYIAGFSSRAREGLDKFDFDTQITCLARADLLYLVLSRFAEVDLHPDAVSNLEMGHLHEELVRRFSELSNGTADEHFTPGEVIRLVVNLPFATDQERIVQAANCARRRTRSSVAALTDQISKLIEHRQALITAVVTGEPVIAEVTA